MGRFLNENDVIGTICANCNTWQCNNHCIVIREIEKLPKTQLITQWIPIQNGFPTKEGMYYVTDHLGHVVRYVYRNSDSSKEYWLRCVKAWMPYPEPYKGE